MGDVTMKQPRREFLVVLGTTSAGCLGSVRESTSDTEGSDLDPDVEVASLLLNWRTSGLHAPYYAAAANGYYADEGLEVDDIESGEGSDFSAKQAGLGNVEFAVTSSDQLLNINTRGLSPRCVAVVMQRGPVVLFAARDHFGEELADPSQLGDATIGSGPGMVRQMTQSYLNHHDVLDAVEYVDTGYDTVQQLLTGKIDVAGGVFGDVVDARHQGYEIDSLSVAETIPFYGHVLVTDEAFASDHPDAVRAFLRGTAHGAVWANRNPEEAVDVLVDAQPELEEVRENQRDKWDLMREEFMLSEAVSGHGWGWSQSEPWDRTYEILEAGDFLDGDVDPDAVWTNDYLDTDYEYIGEYADRI